MPLTSYTPADMLSNIVSSTEPIGFLAQNSFYTGWMTVPLSRNLCNFFLVVTSAPSSLCPTQMMATWFDSN